MERVQGDCFELVFDEPQWAATPGQSAVVYHGEVSLGGGVIAETSMARLDRPVALNNASL